MPGFVKTAKDEELWSKAKDIAAQKFGNAKSDKFYAYANSVFHRMKGLKEEEYPAPFINSLKEDDRWTRVKEYIFKHPVYSELSEDEKYDIVNNIQTQYEPTENEEEQKLYEFVNSYMSYGTFNAGMGTGVPGMVGIGGYRDERPKGPYVYGMPGGQGLTPMYKSPGEPAQVIVPDKKSNYKPWEVELDANGNRVDDVKRTQEISSEDEDWDGELGDVVTALENMGVDVEELQHMTHEELEDMLIRLVKREQAGLQKTKTQQTVSQVKEMHHKILEAFSFEEFMEKFDREGRIQKGRNFLADKLQQKQAIERDEQTRRYKLDQYDIERMLHQHGFTYNYDKKEWLKKNKPFKQPAPQEPISYVNPDDKKPVEDTPVTPTQSTAPVVAEPEVKPVEQPKAVVEPPKEEPKEVNPDKLYDPAIKQLMKTMQARFILGMGHSDQEATKFNEDEKTKEMKPVVPDEAITKKLELLKYSWNPDKLIWLDKNMSLPNVFFNNGEKQKTLVARAFLAALGQINKIQVGDNGKPSVKPENLESTMNDKKYNWDAENHKWKFTPEEKEVAAPMNEADEKKDAEKEGEEDGIQTPKENRLPYNYVDAVQMQGRYVLRASQIDKIHKAGQTEKQPFIEDLVKFDPTMVNQMSFHAVEEKLKQHGFVVKNNIWVDANNENRIPDCVKDMGDDDKSLSGRGVLASKNPKQSNEYIGIHILNGDTPNIKGTPFKSKQWINEQLRTNQMDWNPEHKLWVKAEDEKKKTNLDINRDYMHASALTSDKEKFVDQYRNANWDYMSNEDKEKYKEYTGEALAVKEFGMKPEDWPQGDDFISKFRRGRLIRKFSQNYKFVVDPKSGEKKWVRRDNPVMRSIDKVGLKAAMGSVGRKLVSSTKFGAKAGGTLFALLRKLGDRERGGM